MDELKDEVILIRIKSQKKKDWKESAKKELEDWYRNRQEQLQKTHENNK